MKLQDILKERAGDEHAWHQSLEFKSQMRRLKDFIAQTRNREALSIYKQAAADGRFHPQDVKRLRELMSGN